MMLQTTKNKLFLKTIAICSILSVAPIDTPEFAVKFPNPLSFPLLDIECVCGVDFFQDGNGEVSDVMTTLAEMLASCLADVSIFDIPDMFLHSSPKFPFCFSHILQLASLYQIVDLFMFKNFYLKLRSISCNIFLLMVVMLAYVYCSRIPHPPYISDVISSGLLCMCDVLQTFISLNPVAAARTCAGCGQ